MSLSNLVDALRKELVTVGVPDILEMALMSTAGKVLYSDLSKAAMSRISPFYQNMLILSKGDNLSLNLDPSKMVVASRVSDKAVLIAVTDKKVGLVLTKMVTIANKFGRLLDEFILLEGSRTSETDLTSEAARRPPSISRLPASGTSATKPAPSQLLPEPFQVIESVTEETASAPGPIPPIVEEAVAIIGEAQKSNVILRALGGTAVGIHCPSTRSDPLRRTYPDIDLVGHANQNKEIRSIFLDLKFDPVKRFNALHGAKRLKFLDPKTEIDVDVFLDLFEMCHKLDFKDRLVLDPLTIPLADLLMTKLQIVELNEKDVRDIFAVLLDHEAGKGDAEKIDFDYVASLCSDDWGLWKTLSMNAERISPLVGEYALKEQQRQKIRTQLVALQKRLQDEPKSFRWRMRARVGESRKWYETVEEVQR